MLGFINKTIFEIDILIELYIPFNQGIGCDYDVRGGHSFELFLSFIRIARYDCHL